MSDIGMILFWILILSFSTDSILLSDIKKDLCTRQNWLPGSFDSNVVNFSEVIVFLSSLQLIFR